MINPLRSLSNRLVSSTLQQSLLYSIPLPVYTISQTFTLNQTLVSLKVPYLSIEQGLRMNSYNISSFGRCLILKCEPEDWNCTLPPFFPLQTTSERSGVSLYSIRTVVCRENGILIVYKRLFRALWKKSQSRRIYDVHSSGQWIRQESDSVQEVSWKRVQHLCPLVLHYEKIEHYICFLD